MKINEAIEAINATDSVRAQKDQNVLFVFSKLKYRYNWFLRIDLNTGWTGVAQDFTASLDDTVTRADLARVMEVVQQLVETPVSERFPEKKYRIRFSGLNSDNGHQYLSTDSDGINGHFFACGLRFDLKQEFTVGEIEKLLNRPAFRFVPWFRELIRNNKEEVKDDETN